MAMKSCKLKFIGAAPLLMHNGLLCDPSNEFTKAIARISKKRGKTEADHAEISRLEYLGGLYLNEKKQVIVPSEMIEACLISGAKKLKLGPQAKAGIFCDEDAVLDFDGKNLSPNDLVKEYVLKKIVRVGPSRVVRTRPKFSDWTFTAELSFIDEILSEDTIRQIADRAGLEVGIGDWRPKYGRFRVE